MAIVFRVLLEWLRTVCYHYTARERPLEAETLTARVCFVM